MHFFFEMSTIIHVMLLWCLLPGSMCLMKVWHEPYPRLLINHCWFDTRVGFTHLTRVYDFQSFRKIMLLGSVIRMHMLVVAKSAQRNPFSSCIR